MNVRTLVAVAAVFTVAAVSAALLFRPDTDGSATPSSAPPAVARTVGREVALAPIGGVPDATRSLPRRVAGDVKRRAGVLSGGQHDFTQRYPADALALEEGIEARSHRLLACTDVFGVPEIPDDLALGEDWEEEVAAVAGDRIIPVMVMLSDGGPDGGKVDVQAHGASRELLDCMREAVSDMSVDSPGAQAVHVVVPLRTDD